MCDGLPSFRRAFFFAPRFVDVLPWGRADCWGQQHSQNGVDDEHGNYPSCLPPSFYQFVFIPFYIFFIIFLDTKSVFIYVCKYIQTRKSFTRLLRCDSRRIEEAAQYGRAYEEKKLYVTALEETEGSRSLPNQISRQYVLHIYTHVL